MTPQIAVIMGSNSDYPKLENGLAILDEFGIAYDIRVMSAHRTPDAVAEYARTAEEKGIRVIIAAAGGAAHLPGVIAAYTILPVIGVPIPLPGLGGLDSLLSIAQMPAGIPVATMSSNAGGPDNAALMAIAILALGDEDLADRLKGYRRRLAEGVAEKDETLRLQIRGKDHGKH